MGIDTTISSQDDDGGATVHLAILDEGQVMYIDKLAPPAGLPVPLSAVGKRLPPHCSAVGKVLLAHQPRSIVTPNVPRGLPLTP